MKVYVLKMIQEENQEVIGISEKALNWGQNLKGLVTSFCWFHLKDRKAGDYSVVARDKNGSKFFCFVVKKTENHFVVNEAYSLDSEKINKLCLL